MSLAHVREKERERKRERSEGIRKEREVLWSNSPNQRGSCGRPWVDWCQQPRREERENHEKERIWEKEKGKEGRERVEAYRVSFAICEGPKGLREDDFVIQRHLHTYVSHHSDRACVYVCLYVCVCVCMCVCVCVCSVPWRRIQDRPPLRCHSPTPASLLAEWKNGDPLPFSHHSKGLDSDGRELRQGKDNSFSMLAQAPCSSDDNDTLTAVYNVNFVSSEIGWAPRSDRFDFSEPFTGYFMNTHDFSFHEEQVTNLRVKEYPNKIDPSKLMNVYKAKCIYNRREKTISFAVENGPVVEVYSNVSGPLYPSALFFGTRTNGYIEMTSFVVSKT